MRLPSLIRVPVVLMGLWASQAPGALAQSEPPRGGPGTALFGGSSPESLGRRQFLDLTVSISGAHDDDLSAEQGSPTSPVDPRFGGQYADLDASLVVAQTRSRFGIVARSSGSLRRYPDLGNFVTSSKSAAAALTANLSRHTSLRTSVDASDISIFAFDAFARRLLDDETLLHAGLGDASLNRTSSSYGGIAELTQTVGPRSSLGFIYGIRHNESPLLDNSTRYVEHTGGVRFARAAGEDLSLRAEYQLRRDTQAAETERFPLWSHDVLFGLERQWRHAASRGTVIAVAAGPALLESILPGRDRLRLWRPVGTVNINHEVGRTWRARFSYRRGGGLRDALALSNTAALDVRGQMGRRVDLILSGGYFDRDIELSDRPVRIRTAFGTAKLQVALVRFVAAYGQYFLDHYDYGSDTSRPEGSARQRDRRGFRLGVTMWAPLLR